MNEVTEYVSSPAVQRVLSEVAESAALSLDARLALVNCPNEAELRELLADRLAAELRWALAGEWALIDQPRRRA